MHPNFALLDLNQSVLDLAEQFLERSSLPTQADVDVVHIAAATIHNMDDLLTWNCKHMPMPKFSENWQKLVLIVDIRCRFFVHPMNYLEVNHVPR